MGRQNNGTPKYVLALTLVSGNVFHMGKETLRMW